MLTINNITQKLICSLMVIFAYTTVQGQSTEPTWWYGFSAGTNLNIYNGTTQRLNQSLIVPAAFHKGMGVRAYSSVLIEYRPTRVWGATLNVGYDNRGAKFRGVIAPCNCPATLKANPSYLSVEPAVRFGLNSYNIYFFAGPRVGISLKNDFKYTQLKQPDAEGEFTEIRKTLISAQIGVGYEYDISNPESSTRISLSPFLSYHPYFGQDTRKIESWTLNTIRAGVALKFGKGSPGAQANSERSRF